MLYLVILILLTLFLYLYLRKKINRGIKLIQDDYQHLAREYERLLQENKKHKGINRVLEEAAEETIALYDITKDVCRSLEEEKIFNIFVERISSFFRMGECKFLKQDADIAQYKNYTVLSLFMQEEKIGYLAASGIAQEDKEKFNILTQQFLLGLKRALLYKKVQDLSITDSLTQVFSRRYFLERFNEEAVRSKNFKLRFSFLLVDIDHFKSYNDQYGHLVGDAILREVSSAIRQNTREIDFIGRYGGDELAIILTETDKPQARVAAGRIRQAIESKSIRAYDEQLQVTISIGISTFQEDATEKQTLIDMADQALYLAKEKGKNRVCAYGES